MAGKRKRDILDFDPNKSDPEDESFEPDVDRPAGRSRKKSRASKASKTPRRRPRYGGSDIDDGSDGPISESDQEVSFHEDDEDEEDEPPINEVTGRRRRKAAVKHTNYKESSEDEDVEPIEEYDGKDELAGDTPQKPPQESKIIKLKVPPHSLRKTRANSTANALVGTRRSTRARTADAEDDGDELDLVELSNSGKHALPARASKSKSPETLGRGRVTRGGKGPKKGPPPVIEEPTQEENEDQKNMIDESVEHDKMDVEEAQGPVDEYEELEAHDGAGAHTVENHEPMKTIEDREDGDEDDDDVPVTRRTRSRAAQAENEAANNAREEGQDPTSSNRRRLTRKLQRTKSAQEPSSDFEPGNDSEDEHPASNNSAGEDDDYQSPSSRGRKSSKPKARQPRRSRRQSESAEEEVLDKDEMAEELEDLREDSRPRRRRRPSPEIIFEEKQRRRTKQIDYRIAPLNPANFEVEDDDDEPQTTTPARRRGRANGGTQYDRGLHTLAGPFGGISGSGTLFTGPWGNGSAEAVMDSDSSDDEPGNALGMPDAIPQTPRPGVGTGGNAVTLTLAPNVGKVKNQKALADADPLGVDMSVDFSKVGGMQGHIDQLKEMVQLPLLYPELFTQFSVTPPRGVLFHGPPGTGKTLLARALANSVGIGGRKITFYMRKGADALSKWVGEAEKQLRLLFEEARKTQPSIIFFDEIDGLAPVRSSKQEQIHASIVSTLLALMDGMDGRGQVIVIGATNRPDNIDPALRRPGRFDREFYFPLPDAVARREIINIHTRDWGLSDEFKTQLAKDAKGYGGADLRAMCTEAALNAVQRTYPQIYFSKEKLVVDPKKVSVQMIDFSLAKKQIVPSSERSSASGAAPLPKPIEPLLRDQFGTITMKLDNILPRKKKTTALDEAMYEPAFDDDYGFGREALHLELERARVFRPRLLITGSAGMGQSYLSAAILHFLEGVHIQNFDLPTIFGDARSPEQALVGLFIEVKRHKPSVIFIPNVDTWYQTLTGAALTSFLGMLRSVQPTEPIMVLGTAEAEFKNIDPNLKRDLFGFSGGNCYEITRPVKANREEYFSRIIEHIKRLPRDFPDPLNRKKRILEVLPLAPPPPPKKLTKKEIREENIRYRQYLNQLKVHLQPIMDQISKKYRKFRQPVIPDSQYQYLFDEAQPNYIRPDVDGPPRPYTIDKDSEGFPGLRETATGKFFYNLDIFTMETRLANGYYYRPLEFLRDVRALEHDAKAIGDRERWLKASELLSNVEVDVHDVDQKLRALNIDWEELYRVDRQRKAEREEKARKKKAMKDAVLAAVQSDVSNVGGHGDTSKTTALQRTTAHFQFIGGPVAKGNGDQSSSQAATNGTSVPSRVSGEDVLMTDADNQQLVGSTMPMQPPSQWPLIDVRSLNSSTKATTGGTEQISQVSVIQSLPPGMSPSALANDASTTKTSDPSRRSSNFSTQATNGVHNEHSSPLENLPDTQPYPGMSQNTSSDEQWPHSQAHGLMRGVIQQPSFSQGSRAQNSPPGAKSTHAPSVANLLNDPSPDEQSQPSQRQVELDEGSANFILEALTNRTSGFTIEQIEQITREIMTEIWRTRGENNRMKVYHSITRVYNEAISDIESMQRVLQPSQSQDRYDL